MKPPGKTTLSRMQRTAMLEAERIEISQDGRVRAGDLKEPMPHQVELRDDYAGMVRMIDAINSDQALKDRVIERMAAQAKITAVPLALVDADGDIHIPEAVD
jgi:hypothetical protein